MLAKWQKAATRIDNNVVLRTQSIVLLEETGFAFFQFWCISIYLLIMLKSYCSCSRCVYNEEIWSTQHYLCQSMVIFQLNTFYSYEYIANRQCYKKTPTNVIKNYLVSRIEITADFTRETNSSGKRTVVSNTNWVSGTGVKLSPCFLHIILVNACN